VIPKKPMKTGYKFSHPAAAGKLLAYRFRLCDRALAELMTRNRRPKGNSPLHVTVLMAMELAVDGREPHPWMPIWRYYVEAVIIDAMSLKMSFEMRQRVDAALRDGRGDLVQAIVNDSLPYP